MTNETIELARRETLGSVARGDTASFGLGFDTEQRRHNGGSTATERLASCEKHHRIDETNDRSPPSLTLDRRRERFERSNHVGKRDVSAVE